VGEEASAFELFEEQLGVELVDHFAQGHLFLGLFVFDYRDLSAPVEVRDEAAHQSVLELETRLVRF
jgi:hypothetical protein